MPVAFCDVRTNTYIDCNLAFYVKGPPSSSMGEDGVEYALGVPCEIPIVVALKLEDNASTDNANDKGVANLSKVVPINPNDNDFWEGSEAMMRDEEKEEVFQLMARALIDELAQRFDSRRLHVSLPSREIWTVSLGIGERHYLEVGANETRWWS